MAFFWLVFAGSNVPSLAQEKDEVLYKGKPAAFWINQLKDRDVTFRLGAIQALAEIGPDADGAIGALISQAHKDKDESVRKAVTEALVKLPLSKKLPEFITILYGKDADARLIVLTLIEKEGIKAKAAVPHLIECLNGEPPVRLAALKALAECGKDSYAAIAAVYTVKKADPEGAVRQAATNSLDKLGPAANLPALNELLDSAEGDRKIQVVHEIANLGGSTPKAVEILFTALNKKDVTVRIHAARTLSQLGKPRTAVATLVESLTHEDASVRATAASFLGILGKPALKAVPALEKCLADPAAPVREEAAKALRNLGRTTFVLPDTLNPNLALSSALTALKGKDANRRSQAAMALATMGADATEGVPALIEALKDKHDRLDMLREFDAKIVGNDFVVRKEAVIALGKIGPYSKDALPLLEKFVAEPANKPYREWAVQAMTAIRLANPQSSIEDLPALMKTLRGDEQDSVKLVAVSRLAELGSKATDAIPPLIDALKSTNQNLQGAAGDALVKIGPQAIPSLVEALADKRARRAAAKALRGFGPAGKEAVPALIEALKEGDANAAHALSRMGKPAIAQLVEIMRKEMQFRQIAGETLAMMGPEAKEAVPALLELLKEEKAERPKGGGFVTVPSIQGQFGQPGQLTMTVDGLVKSRQKIVLNVLAALGPDAVQALSAVIDLTKDQDESVRAMAAMCVRWIGPKEKDTVAALVQLLDDKSNMVCWRTLQTLEEVGGPALPAIPALIELAKGKRAKEPPNGHLLADQAKRCIAKIMQGAMPSKENLPALVAVLQEKGFAADSLDAVAKLGADAKAAIPVIRPYLLDENFAIAVHAAEALIQIDGEKAEHVAVLKAAMYDGETRPFAIAAMFRLGKISEEEFVAFHELRLHDREEFVEKRLESARMLRRTGKASRHELAALIDLLESGIGGWQLQAIEAIAEIGSDAKGTLPYLTTLLQKNQGIMWPTIRVAVCKALPTLGTDAKSAVPILLRAINDDHPQIRWNAMQALIAIDMDAAKKAGVR
jgi:HEAT repeat protein